MTHQRGIRGFTLIELSVVLFIIAIVVGMSTTMSISVIATAHLTATQKKMKTISDALMQFRTATDRLPCPGDLTIAPGGTNYGLEAGAGSGSAIAVGTGVCTGTGMLPAANHTAAGATNTSATGAEGALPAVTLGLPPDFMLDGWGNKIRYAVDIAYTAKAAFASTGAGCVNGAITVKDASENARSTGSVYALISHGANGHGAYTPSGATVNAGSSSADELTNCHCTSAGAYNSAYAPTYVQKLPAYDSGHTASALYYFDDLVSYKERWQMRTDWDKTGGCPYIYVADSGNNRVQKFDMSGNYLSQFGTSGTGNGQFSFLDAIAFDKSGNIWATDSNNNRVQKLDANGNFLLGIGAGYQGVGGSIGSSGNGNGQFHSPFGIAIDSNGNIWVADSLNARVQEFSSSGTFLNGIGSGYNGISGSIGSTGSGNGQFGINGNGPYGITIDSSGNIWVMDVGNARVQKFNSSGTYLSQFGSSGSGNGQFGLVGSWGACSPSNGLAVDTSGNIWVSDECNNRVEKFNSSGTYLTQLGCGSGACSAGSGNGEFGVGPTGITTDSNNNIWVPDESDNRVQEFSSSGAYVSQFGSSGSGNGQFNSPQEVVIVNR